MGTISINRLGGLSLIIGPVIALVFYFLSPGQLTEDPANTVAFVGAMQANVALTNLTSFMVPIGLIIMLFGFHALQCHIRSSGNGEALSRLGVMFLFIATIGWVMGTAMSFAIANGADAVQVGQVYAVAGGFNSIGTLAGGLAIFAFSMAISTRDDFNKNAALVVALSAVVLVVVTVIGITDTTQLQTMSTIGGICYLITSAWSIMLGMALRKTG
ncbi:hypothetical protein FIM04_03640 [SAR202 cluster bacterium AC-409-J13_OGT_754m]|nr:hypothetical protein [SAR202 cluster bacterium AC-409-J13_OGT_754m]